MTKENLLKFAFILIAFSIYSVSRTSAVFSRSSAIVKNQIVLGHWSTEDDDIDVDFHDHDDRDHDDKRDNDHDNRDNHKKHHRVGFEIRGRDQDKYDHCEYEISYKSKGIDRVIRGERDMKNGEDFNASDIIIGSCSSDNVCVYDDIDDKVTLKVHLRGRVDREIYREL